MVDYGNGNDGSVTYSSNTTINKSNASYTNLTIEGGTTVTFDNYATIRVSDTLTIDGTLSVSYGPVGGAGANGSDTSNDTNNGGDGGSGAGHINIIAKNVEGTGTIDASGEAGNDGDSHSDTADEGFDTTLNDGTDGTKYTYLYNTTFTQNTASDGGQSIDDKGQDNVTGGSGGTNLREDAYLKPYMEDWLLSGTILSSTILEQFQTSSGAGGGGGNESDSSVAASDIAYGGAGGGGGGFIGTGGTGGDSLETTNDIAKGAGGAGGGGSGGLIILVTDSYTGSVTADVSGGDGGDGGSSADNHGGGGGGGGGGGLVVFFTDSNYPDVTLSGGAGGAGASNANNGNVGEDGMVFALDIEMV